VQGYFSPDPQLPSNQRRRARALQGRGIRCHVTASSELLFTAKTAVVLEKYEQQSMECGHW
jgi:hypothetical protein